MRFRRHSIVITFLILMFALVQRGCPAKTHGVQLYVDHQVKRTLSLEIKIDGKAVYSGTAKVINRKPPIFVSKELKLKPGRHVVEFIDKTRVIHERRAFYPEKIKTILVRTRKDAIKKRHIILSADRMPIK